jgi:hypothetical protein
LIYIWSVKKLRQKYFGRYSTMADNKFRPANFWHFKWCIMHCWVSALFVRWRTFLGYSTIAAKILWSSLFDTSNVNKVLMSIYMTISNYSCQKYGIFSFWSIQNRLTCFEGCLNRDHVDLLLLQLGFTPPIWH